MNKFSFPNLKKIGGQPVRLSNRNYQYEMHSLLSTRKGQYVLNPNYGLSDIASLVSVTSDLVYLIPILTVHIKADIEENSDFSVTSLQVYRDTENKKVLNIYIKYRTSSGLNDIILLKVK